MTVSPPNPMLAHDWRFAVLAMLVCLAGMAVTIMLMTRARAAPTGARRRLKASLAALTGGLTLWAAHLINMAGLKAPVPINYDLGLTLLSVVVVTAGFAGAVRFGLRGRSTKIQLVAGLVGMAGLLAMHFIGIAAMDAGGRVVIDPVRAGFAVLMTVALTVSTAYARRFGVAACSAVAALTLGVLYGLSGRALGVTSEPAITTLGAGVSETLIVVWTLMTVAALSVISAVVAGMASWSRFSALRQLRQAIDAMPDGLAFYDAEDRLVLWNSRYAEVNPELAAHLRRGQSFRVLLETGLAEGLYPDAVGREAEWLEQRLIAHRSTANAAEQHIAGDRWLRIQDRRTVEGGVVTVVNDITDLKRDARALAEARDSAEAANTAKSQFLANMSHEIRTPLNGVIGVAQALSRTHLDIEQREMLELIHSSGQTLQTLLSDILDLARVESGRLSLAVEPFDLTRAIREAAQLYASTAEAKGLSFFIDVAPEVDGWVMGDVVRLKQILTNLVSNAVKFTESGFVSLNVARGPDRSGAPTLRFTVEDTGIGFDGATRDRLFSRFEQADGAITRRFGGSGLGLAICRQLAVMMEGELDCESEPGGGSAFLLTIPLIVAETPDAVEPPAAAPALDAEPEAAATVLRVLLADDHPTNRKVVELILGQAPVELHTVENGVEAVEAYRAEIYDLVLMDMQMPVMDGLTATREIRLHETALGVRRTPIVMLTANALAEHIAAAQDAGADRHLAKPFEASELLGLLQLGLDAANDASAADARTARA